MRLGATLVALVLTVSSAAATIQLPFGNSDSASYFDHLKGHTPHSAFDTFIKHFSANRSGTDVVIQRAVEAQFPKQHVVTTQDWQFDLLRFADGKPDEVLVRELDDIESIKRAVYARPRNRKDPGRLLEQMVFGGWQVARGNDEFTVILATWSEGFSQAAQWHIVSRDRKLAQQLVFDVTQFCSRVHNAIWVFDHGFWSPNSQLWDAVQKASWDDVILDEEFKKNLQHDYRSFFKAKKTYERLNVPWKRGIILLGPPGNGKTISLKAIMHEMQDIDVEIMYVKTLHGYAGDENSINQIFKQARRESPCILIFEDLDSIINDDNRSYFFNEIDGIAENDGILMFGTTNHFDRLDPGLSSRPSRFDRKYTFPNPNPEERREYAVYWQNKLKDVKDVDFPDSLIDEFADKTYDFSFAFMKEAFISALLTIATHEGDKPDFGKLLLKQVANLRKEIEDGDDKDLKANQTSLPPVGAHGGGGGGFRPGRGEWRKLPEDGLMFNYPHLLNW